MFSVRLADDDGWLAFTQPRTVLRASESHEALRALEEVEAALRDGYWIAGYLSYELASAFVNETVAGAGTLLTLGVFEEPAVWNPRLGPFALSPLLPLVTYDRYERALERIRAGIYDGEFYQVNYTVPFALAIEGDPLEAFCAIAERTGARYQAYVEDGTRRILSWSPELFLRFDGDRLETRPMKGTAPLDAMDRLHDEKNRAEHVMIVDLLRNDLRRICRDADVDALCSLERYATFATMTSTISGTVREGTSIRAVFEAMFPCGSITGAPKRAAVAAISALESHGRGAYCGSIGFLSPSRRGWWNVAIRTAQIDGTQGRFDAGGGIVSDSTPEDEWREVLLKTSFLREPFELWETLASNAPLDVIERHIERLSESAARFGITLERRLLRARLQSAPSNRLLRIRLASDGELTVLEEPLTPEVGVAIVLAPDCVRSDDPFLGIKSSWRPAHRRAFAYARERGAFDALLRNERDELTEGSRTNLFARLDGELVTPPLEAGLLPGIFRAQMLERGDARERVIHADDLERITALYVGNSARGLMRARLLMP